MLFKTIYGPEIESIYFWLNDFGPARKDTLADSFGNIANGVKSSTANLDDAILFLIGSGVVYLDSNLYHVRYKDLDSTAFKTILLKHLRSIKKGISDLDPYFINFIDLLYIKPDVVFHNSLHKKINSLELQSPCSEEKVNAWRRVLEYLGLGFRGYGGLTVCYCSEILENIINKWDHTEGPLQIFFEDHFDLYLPWLNSKGDIAQAVKIPLIYLERKGLIKLNSKQDLPHKSYMGKRKIKWLTRKEI